MLMFPETIEPLYWPPWRFFSAFAGKAAFGGFGVKPLLLTCIEEGSNPVPLPFPMKSFPSATASAEGYCPVGMKPRILDLATSSFCDEEFGPRAFSEMDTTATALL